MSDIKYDSESINIHSFCDLLIENNAVNIRYCRYKENPFNTSGCSLTNGISDDTTKSKEVSNTVNSLHALGFLKRSGNNLLLTENGCDFSNTDFNSTEMLDIIRKAVLKYGLFIGVLYQIHCLGKDTFDTSEINVGYPKANEKLLYNGSYVTISSGSEDDSNTRTKSCILAWATTAGFIYPIPLLGDLNTNNPHISSSDYILQSSRNLRKYKVLEIPNKIFSGEFITEKPFDYKNLTKNIGALRENNQQSIRELTMQVEPKIQNRRFAVLYILNKAFNQQTSISLNTLVSFMLHHEAYFVIEKERMYHTMCEEINIAIISGLLFEIKESDIIHPLTGVNINELSLNAPNELVNILDTFIL
ncbi:hypothetical protein [Flavobacterium sp.]|uniref:hypothetical protein n=1 Tax=Flavobacterium sp. TaxID=239 RepID=UPI002634D778|nr:hypothetical protein [Flavobacterium sp.]